MHKMFGFIIANIVFYLLFWFVLAEQPSWQMIMDWRNDERFVFLLLYILVTWFGVITCDRKSKKNEEVENEKE